MRDKPIEAEEHILSTYHDDITRLKNKEYAGLNFRKFKGRENTFYFNTSYSDRLIVTEEPDRVIIAKEILEHVYRPKSIEAAIKKAKNSPGLKRFEEKQKAVTDFPVSHESPSIGHKPGRMTFYKKLMFLSEQQFALLQKKLPMKVSGGPGSGKTCVARELLASKAVLATKKAPLSLLYMTKSPKLAKEMEGHLKTHPLYKKIKRLMRKGHLKVHFKTTDEIFGRTYGPQDEENFNAWLKNYLSYQNTRNKIAGRQDLQLQFTLFQSPSSLLQEFRAIVGKEREKYKGLGPDDSYVPQDARDVFFDAFENYCNQHPNNPLLPNLEKEDKSQHDLVLYDEAQDGTEIDLQKAFQKARDNQIAFFNSNVQRLVDGLSNETNFTSLCKEYYELEEVYLSQSFRNPGVVSEYINFVEDLQHDFMKALFEKPSRAPKLEPNAKPGFIKWRTPEELQRPFVRSVKRAIITLPQYREEAIALFGSSLVFTIDEIKGLEFDEVYLYKFFEEDVYKDINRVFEGKPLKNALHPQTFTTAFNKIKTACSRTTQDLYIVQDKHHDIQTLAEKLDRGIPTNTKPAESKEEKAADAGEVLAKAKSLYMTNEPQALGLLTNELKKPENEARALIQQWKEQDKPSTSSDTQTQATSKPTEKSQNKNKDQGRNQEGGAGPTNASGPELDRERQIKNFLSALNSLNKKSSQKLNNFLASSQFAQFIEQEIEAQDKTKNREACLLYKLLNSQTSEKPLLENLNTFLHTSPYLQKMSEYFTIFINNDRGFVLKWLADPEGLKIFKQMLNNSTFAEQLQASSLFGMPDPTGTQHSLATYLGSDPEVCQELEKLLIKNPGFMDFLAENLSKKEEQARDYLETIHFFQALSQHPKGRKIIRSLIKYCPDVQEKLKDIQACSVPQLFDQKAVQTGLRKVSEKLSQQAKEPSDLLSEVTEGLLKLYDKKLPSKPSRAANKHSLFKEEPKQTGASLADCDDKDLIKQFTGTKDELAVLFKRPNVIFLLFNVPKLPFINLFAFLVDKKQYSVFHNFVKDPVNISAALKLSRCLSMYPEFSASLNASPVTVFSFLSRFPQGINLIAYLYGMNPHALVSKEGLCDRDEVGRSALYNLISANGDLSWLIIEILQRDPDLISQFMPEDLSFPAQTVAYSNGTIIEQLGPSLLSVLCRYKKFPVLEFVLLKKPILLVHALQRDLKELAELKEKHSKKFKIIMENSGIYQIIATPEGCKFFYEILSQPSEDKRISISYAARIFDLLCTTYTQGQTFWSLIMQSPYGEAIAAKLRSWNPHLKIPASPEKRTPSEEKATTEEGPSSFSMIDANTMLDPSKREAFLANFSAVRTTKLDPLMGSETFFSKEFSEGGSNLLPYLHHPASSVVCSLGVHFFYAYLCISQDFNFSHGALFQKRNNNYAAFFVLCAYLMGQLSLDYLFANNKLIFTGMKPEDLYLCPWIKEASLFKDSDYHPFENTTPMYWLSVTPPGAKILVNLFELNPELLSAMTPDIFYSNPHN